MIILGISELDNDAGACAWVDGQVFAAANEERFSRKKQHAGFPFLAVEWICGQLDMKPSQFDGIAIAKPPQQEEIESVQTPLKSCQWRFGNRTSWTETILTRLAFRFYRLPRHRRSVKSDNHQLQEWLQANNLKREQILSVDHHRAHAMSAYLGSGWNDCLVVTCDGQGGGVTGTVWRAADGVLQHLQSVYLPHSMGNFYAAATKALGFRPNRHEGKVTGLAAYATPTPEDLALLRQIAWFENDRFYAPCVYGAYPRLCRWLQAVGKERFAATFQQVLEEVVGQWVAYHINQTNSQKVAMAGGVFANVKLNQRVAALDGVDEVFVFPGMADGGLGHGAAAVWDWVAGEKECQHGLQNVFWGPEPSEQQCREALMEAGWKFERPTNLAEKVGRLLAKGEIVGVCRGRMEFGPRALGNRSILYQPTDPTVNDWLNKALRRTEFMPFAPITRQAEADLCYPDLGCLNTARFMTITTTCSEHMKTTCPAVVHVDGTARPQIVLPDQQPFLHEVLSTYVQQTGIPSLINTSFNLHEEPIVCSAEDAVRAARSAQLGYLVLGPFLATISCD